MEVARSVERWKYRAKRLKTDLQTLYLASRDPRVPWPIKFFIIAVIGYAFSPIDLIPDFIPVLGYLDDLVLIPLGIALALKMIPAPILVECRERAAKFDQGKRKNWVAATLIVAIWVAVTSWIVVSTYTVWYK
ncbi:MAG: YkvA family protein [Bacillota bacterium]